MEDKFLYELIFQICKLIKYVFFSSAKYQIRNIESRRDVLASAVQHSFFIM